MTSTDIYSSFKPTYLYIKQHSVTGKLYFGKTVKNPEKYYGSGLHWKRHIQKHGKEHIQTLWYCLFLDQESCTEFALNFSEQQNIVESNDWLNKTLENGLDGMSPSFKHSNETRTRMSKTHIKNPVWEGKHFSDSHKKNLSLSHKGQVQSKESNYSRSKKLSNISKIKVSCPHCNKSGGEPIMKRWHFDNCKFKI